MAAQGSVQVAQLSYRRSRERKRQDTPFELSMVNYYALKDTASAVFPKLEQVVCHILQNILGTPSTEPSCPVCRNHIARWNFIYVADGIFHLLRHLTPANSSLAQPSRKAKFPCCFVLLSGPSKVFTHIEMFLLRALEFVRPLSHQSWRLENLLLQMKTPRHWLFKAALELN